MSTTAIPASAWASEDWQLETNADLKPAHLVVQLRRCAHILPWFRFVHAEGDNDQVKITFASHLVTVTGHGLAALVAQMQGATPDPASPTLPSSSSSKESQRYVFQITQKHGKSVG
jgi:hypothetical protein